MQNWRHGEQKLTRFTGGRFSALRPLVSELLSEHSTLRDFFTHATTRILTENDLREFAKILSDHIRKEERQLFEGMQQLMKPEDLATLGQALDKALESASESCVLPNAATRLRPLPKS
jgi:hemerythrin-like domain-containing protein